MSERAAHEMDAAFESDDDEEEHQESKPLAGGLHSEDSEESRGEAPAYDFEREYDYPPPGSPPAMPSPSGGVAAGNSNGIIPSPGSPTTTRGFDWTPRTRGPGAFFRRAVGVLLPTHYTSVPTSNEPARGSGIENDGRVQECVRTADGGADYAR